ncbi:MAG: serine protease [Vallitaleaceae bacterium]|nr:serine protease [Vallitaleaceae bacterium]
MLLTSCKPSVLQGVESSLYEENDVQKLKITAPQAEIRTSCSTNGEVAQTANQGASFDVISKVSDWYAVQLPNNTVGFVPQSECKAIIDETQPIKLSPTAQKTPAQTTGKNPSTEKATTAKDSTAGTATKATKDSTANSASLTEDEKQMVDLVNKARAENNLSPLSVDMEVVKVARIKAQDMIDTSYFSHNSPTYGSPFDMLKSFSVHYVLAGENIAGNQTVAAAHDALMNSPGHKANILKTDYTHIGIGIIDGGSYGKMFTQMFVSKPK